MIFDVANVARFYAGHACWAGSFLLGGCATVQAAALAYQGLKGFGLEAQGRVPEAVRVRVRDFDNRIKLFAVLRDLLWTCGFNQLDDAANWMTGVRSTGNYYKRRDGNTDVLDYRGNKIPIMSQVKGGYSEQMRFIAWNLFFAATFSLAAGQLVGGPDLRLNSWLPYVTHIRLTEQLPALAVELNKIAQHVYTKLWVQY